MSLRDSRAGASFADERHSVTAKTDWNALSRDATFIREQHAPTQKGPPPTGSRAYRGDWQTKFMQLLTLLEILCVFSLCTGSGISSDVFLQAQLISTYYNKFTTFSQYSGQPSYQISAWYCCNTPPKNNLWVWKILLKWCAKKFFLSNVKPTCIIMQVLQYVIPLISHNSTYYLVYYSFIHFLIEMICSYIYIIIQVCFTALQRHSPAVHNSCIQHNTTQ